MLQTLSIRKSIKKLASNKRGFSSIVGAIFAVLIIFSLTSTVFVWSLDQNNKYNKAVSQSTQSDIDRLNEKALANVTAYYVNNTYVTVNGTLQNSGSLIVKLNTLWVVDSTNNYTSISPQNITLKAGTTMNLTGPTALTVPLTNNKNDTRICWFVSSRGNIISQYSLVLATIQNQNITTVYQTVNNVTTSGNFTADGNVTTVYNVGGVSTTYSNVSQGIGLLAFDFKGFSHQDFESAPSSPNNHLNNLKKTYVISQNNYTVFHVTLTNYDPNQKNMYLNGSSGIYVIGMHSQTMMYAWWKAVNVTGNTQSDFTVNPGSTDITYVLPYGQPQEVFFAGSQSGKAVDPGIYPLNIMVFGKLGTDDYGQNVPFVAINLQT